MGEVPSPSVVSSSPGFALTSQLLLFLGRSSSQFNSVFGNRIADSFHGFNYGSSAFEVIFLEALILIHLRLKAAEHNFYERLCFMKI